MNRFDDIKQDVIENARQHPTLWLAAVLGLLMMAIAPALLRGEPLLLRLAICVGLALLLSAAGSAATVRRKGAVVTGAAAIALLLFFATAQVGGQSSPIRFLRVKAANPSGFPLSAQVSIWESDSLLGAMRGEGRSRYYLAVIEPDRLRSNVVTVDITGAKGEQDSGRSPIEIDVAQHILPRQNDDTIVWTYDIAREQLFDEVGRSVERSSLQAVSTRLPLAGDDGWAAEASTALSAMVSTAIPAALAADTQTLDHALDGLTSSNLQLRRASRDQLASMGTVAVAPAVALATSEPAGEQATAQAGAIYSLSQIQRRNPGSKDEIRAEVSEDEVNRLVQLLAASDSGVRYYTADFLAGIQETRAAAPLARLIQDPSTSADTKFNASTVLREIGPHLSAEQRQALGAQLDRLDLRQLGPRTRDNVESLLHTP